MRELLRKPMEFEKRQKNLSGRERGSHTTLSGRTPAACGAEFLPEYKLTGGADDRRRRGGKDAAKKWAELSDRQRALLFGAAAAELSLKIAALIDIKRRPADRIRGPKALWRAAMVVNLLGPLSYFVIGRKR